jgi:ABC-type phosphate transport system substrate-binding protein
MVKHLPGDVLAACVVVAAALGLTGCGIGAGGGSTATTLRSIPSTTIFPAANKLAAEACQDYRTAAANPDAFAAYRQLFTADAEADSAGRLAGTWSNLAAALDTVRTQIVQIDQYQSGSSGNGSANAATLNQAQGQLTGDLRAVALLCKAGGL